MVGRKSILSRKSSTLSSISDMDPLSPKESLPSSPKALTSPKGALVNEILNAKEPSDKISIETNSSSVSLSDKTELSRTETVPLKASSSSSSSSLHSKSSSSDKDSIAGIPFAKKSSRKSSTSNDPSLTSDSSKFTFENAQEISINHEKSIMDSNNDQSSDDPSKRTTPPPSNILDILDTVKLDNEHVATETEIVQSESVTTKDITISETVVTKNNDSFHDNTRDKFFASLTEPSTTASIQPLSPSLNLSSKKVETTLVHSSETTTTIQTKQEEEAYVSKNWTTIGNLKPYSGDDNPDTAPQMADKSNVDFSVKKGPSREIQDGNVANPEEASQIESETVAQPRNNLKNEGNRLLTDA